MSGGEVKFVTAMESIRDLLDGADLGDVPEEPRRPGSMRWVPSR